MAQEDVDRVVEAGAEGSVAEVNGKSEAERKAEALEFKNRGNQFFNECRFEEALEQYSNAIACEEQAVYYANRAFCQIKLEAYGAAIQDATAALRLDNTYIKAYYRRGAAYLGLGRFKAGLNDFAKVTKIFPKNKQARNKYNECKKAVTQAAFAKAIESERTKPASEVVQWRETVVSKTYDGPVWKDDEPISDDFVNEMMELFTNQKTLPSKYAYRMICEMIELLKTLPTLVDITVPQGRKITVCGDIHGQYFDLLNIFHINGLPSETNPYLFNGDMVDRGSWSTECIFTLFAFKLLRPASLHCHRGNHEAHTLNVIYGFSGEVHHKYDAMTYQLFTEAFQLLPLGSLIGEKVLVLHGGLFSNDGITLDDLRKIDRNCQPGDDGIMCEMLWSDPRPDEGRAPSKRGVGIAFGPDVTKKFLDDNKLELLVRSHEVKHNGYEVEAEGRLITVFSAPNYCDQMGNKGAFIHFFSDMKPKFTTFDAVPHPNVRPMAYASPGLMG